MFVLIANEDKRRIDSVPTRKNEIIYLYKDDEYKFPHLSSLDNYSHTFFITNDTIDELISELNLAKTEDEIEIVWKKEKNECIAAIAKLELECINVYNKNHWRVIESKEQLTHMKQYFKRMERGEIISPSIAEVFNHLDAIILLARKYQKHPNSTLIYTPFK